MAERYAYQVRVPKDRVAVIIGEKGAVKKALESHLKVRMEVDSQDGVVTLDGEDSLSLYTGRQVITAIARGFNPEIAQLLMRHDHVLEVIKLTDYTGSKDAMLRLKGRVIGANGKSRARMEEATECFISVYGKTVGIIGENEHAMIAKRAVEKLLQGSMHATVWKYLERAKRQLKAEEYGRKGL